MRLFDAYLVVDWSARNGPSAARPSADALWVGEGRALEGLGPDGGVSAGPDGGGAPRMPIVATYWRTRQACVSFLRERLLWHAARGRRVLVGFDFALGYPAGFAQALGLAGEPGAWRRVWGELERLVRDDAANRNNRFAVAAALNERCGRAAPGAAPGPFWGCPEGSRLAGLRATSPGFPYAVGAGFTLARLRRTEQVARGAQPVWKLYGPGSVGGQTLTGIPALARLRADPRLAGIGAVWPFETGFSADPMAGARPAIVFAEVWPSLAPGVAAEGGIRDRAQVLALVRWLAATDGVGRLGHWFAPPAGLAREELAACAGQEGWILGAGVGARGWAGRTAGPHVGGGGRGW